MNIPPLSFVRFSIISIFLSGLVLAGCARVPGSAADTANSPEKSIAPHAEMTVYIMATCPYCARALETAILPLYFELDGSLAVSVAYVGTTDESGVPDLAHGDTEVASAIIELCAASATDEANWFSFMRCMYRDNLWQDMEKNWTSCASAARIPSEDVRHCIEKGGGRDALTRSIALSAAEHIQAAPSIFIDGKEYVGPIDKESLLTHICYFSGKPSTRPKICETIPEPELLKATFLNDIRCGERCDVTSEIDFLKSLFPAMEIAELDYSEPDGKALYQQMEDELGEGFLPALYIEETMDDLGVAAIPLTQYLVTFGDGFVLPLGEGFDPTAELCDNGVDDDNNGRMDCEDATCAGTPACREEIPHRMDLFIMSQCPYAAMIIPAADHVVRHLQQNGSPATLRLQFIGEVREEELMSMHGPAEVAEDLRMACIQELYPTQHGFMTYMMCRARNIESENWQQCLSETMVEKEVTDCATGTRGVELLQQSFRLAEEVSRNASPSWMLNNRLEMNARTATEIFNAYCSANDDPACQVEIKPLLIDKDIPALEKCE